MPFADRDGFIIRILRRNSPTRSAGIGFVVGERHVITCAHVINTALGRGKTAQEPPGPDERLQIDFPILADADGAPSRSCRVACWLPPPEAGVSGGDVAGLVFVGEGLPGGAGPARLISDDRIRGAEVEVFGYPADRPDRQNGAWVSQRLRSAVGGGMFQLDTGTESAIRAQPGYSGSPVVTVDGQGDAVAGMFAIAATDDGRDTYAIPVTQLAAAWPAVLGKPEVLGRAAAGGAISAVSQSSEPTDPPAQSPSRFRDFLRSVAPQPAAPQPVAPQPVALQPVALQPTAPQPGLQQPTLPQVIAGNWLIDIQAPQFGFMRMMLTLAIDPFGQLQFQGSFVGTPMPMAVQGLWWVMGNQIKLSGIRVVSGPLPQQYPYEVIVTFASWSYAQLIGISSDGESVVWRRQN
jgi:hypothetical protein